MCLRSDPGLGGRLWYAIWTRMGVGYDRQDAPPELDKASSRGVQLWMVRPSQPVSVPGLSQTLIMPALWSSPLRTLYHGEPPSRAGICSHVRRLPAERSR